MLSTLSNIPLWVVPLLTGLIWLGRRATSARAVPPLLIYALPLLGLMTLARAVAMPLAALALGALVPAYLVGAVAGYGVQPRWIVARDPRRVHLRGEWATMATILCLFGLNFAAGMVEGMAPALSGNLALTLGYGVTAGLLSGSLAGRAMRVALWPVQAGR